MAGRLLEPATKSFVYFLAQLRLQRFNLDPVRLLSGLAELPPSRFGITQVALNFLLWTTRLGFLCLLSIATAIRIRPLVRAAALRLSRPFAVVPPGLVPEVVIGFLAAK